MSDETPINVDVDGTWNDTMLRSPGLIVLRFSALEFCAERLLHGFISDSPLGFLVVAGQDMSWKLDRLKTLSEVVDTLNAWIRAAEVLNGRRNELIHSVWTVGAHGVPVAYRPRGRGKWNVRGLAVTADMLADLAIEIREATALAVKISADLKAHPQWRGRPIDEAEPPAK